MPMSLTLRRAHPIDLHTNRIAFFSTGMGSTNGFAAAFRRLPSRHAREFRKKFRRRIKAFIVLSLLVIALQAFFLFLKVFEVPPEIYSEIAFDLQLSPGWRYGYVKGWHGAVLIKTANQAEAFQIAEEIGSDEITQSMSRELEMVPWKFYGELIFYLGMLAFVLFVPRWLAYRLSISGRQRLIIPMYIALWVAAWIAFLLPLLATGYGASIFSTWKGPGAASYSGPHPRATAVAADTVSYRPLVEAAAMWPLIIGDIALDLIPNWIHIPFGLGMLFFGVLLYGGYGLLFGANCYLNERNRMVGGRCQPP